MGILTASAATGQLIFLPLLARVIDRVGWRTASAIVAVAALVTAPIAAWLLRDFHGLDWIATVPPTVRLASDAFGAANVGVMFASIVAAHQLGAASAWLLAGVLRTAIGDYAVAFWSPADSASWPRRWCSASAGLQRRCSPRRSTWARAADQTVRRPGRERTRRITISFRFPIPEASCHQPPAHPRSCA